MSSHDETSDHVFEPILTESVVLEMIQDQQLGLADQQHVNTQPLRACSVSTTITDLRQCFFVDNNIGRQREACICFFQIECGGQKQRSRQRITNLDVEIMFNDIEEDPNQSSSSIPDDAELLCKTVYPISAYGTEEFKQLSRTMEAEIKPAYMDISLGGVTFSRTTKQARKAMTTLIATTAGEMGRRLELAENSIHESGVPHVFRFAVLLQTDGLPFTIALRFLGKTPLLLGARLGGRIECSIDKKHLWVRKRNDEGAKCCQDADSDAFLSWVKSKTRNPWAQVSDYDV